MSGTTDKASSHRPPRLSGVGAAGAAALLAGIAGQNGGCVRRHEALDKYQELGVTNIGIREAAPPDGSKDANLRDISGFGTDIAKAIYAAVDILTGRGDQGRITLR